MLKKLVRVPDKGPEWAGFGPRAMLNTKAMRSVKRYACYAKTAELRVIPTSVITVINGNNSVTLMLMTGVPFR